MKTHPHRFVVAYIQDAQEFEHPASEGRGWVTRVLGGSQRDEGMGERISFSELDELPDILRRLIERSQNRQL